MKLRKHLPMLPELKLFILIQRFVLFINKLNSKIIKTFTKSICLKNKWPDIK